MRDELAENLLARVMSWEEDQLMLYGGQLQALAAHKYDEYGGYRPGVKFLESLAGWLQQFELADRRIAARFVLERLVFLSAAEIDHAVEVAYPDVIRPRLIARVAAGLGLPSFAIRRVAASAEFQDLQRKTLILGLADGARLDKLRRSNPHLSHEQFWSTWELGHEGQRSLLKALSKAIKERGLPEPAHFRHVLLVDDFSGSGYTMIREESDGTWGGKLHKINGHLSALSESGVLSTEFSVGVLLYVASHRAEETIRSRMNASGLNDWDLDVVQRLPEWLPVSEEDYVEWCKYYYDEALTDDIKGDAALGYAAAALPVVLHHNTPNNSVAVLWGDTTQVKESHNRRALFPRYERHHQDRT